jgi:hypothetical protein
VGKLLAQIAQPAENVDGLLVRRRRPRVAEDLRADALAAADRIIDVLHGSLDALVAARLAGDDLGEWLDGHQDVVEFVSHR